MRVPIVVVASCVLVVGCGSSSTPTAPTPSPATTPAPAPAPAPIRVSSIQLVSQDPILLESGTRQTFLFQSYDAQHALLDPSSHVYAFSSSDPSVMAIAAGSTAGTFDVTSQKAGTVTLKITSDDGLASTNATVYSNGTNCQPTPFTMNGFLSGSLDPGDCEMDDYGRSEHTLMDVYEFTVPPGPYAFLMEVKSTAFPVSFLLIDVNHVFHDPNFNILDEETPGHDVSGFWDASHAYSFDVGLPAATWRVWVKAQSASDRGAYSLHVFQVGFFEQVFRGLTGIPGGRLGKRQ